MPAAGACGYGDVVAPCAAGGYAEGYGDAEGYLLCADAEYGVVDGEYAGGYVPLPFSCVLGGYGASYFC